MGTRWVTWLDGQEATVEITRYLPAQDGAPARVEAIVFEGERRRALTLSLPPARGQGRRWVVDEDGHGHQAWIGPTRADGVREVRLGGASAELKVVSELDAWLGSGDDAAGSGAVTVAMPGRVVKVLASLGDSVDKGQPVLIIEAMKMENEVKAPRGGIVRGILVDEGDSVEGGKTLMEIGD